MSFDCAALAGHRSWSPCYGLCPAASHGGTAPATFASWRAGRKISTRRWRRSGATSAIQRRSPRLRRTQVVLHAASAMPGQRDEPRGLECCRRFNVAGTLALAPAAAAAGSSASSSSRARPPWAGRRRAGRRDPPASLAAPPRSPSARPRKACSTMAAGTSMPVTILRPCVITGSGQRGGMLLKLFALARRGLFPAFGGRLDVQKALVESRTWSGDPARRRRRGEGRPLPDHPGRRHTLLEMLAIAGRLIGHSGPTHHSLQLARLAAAVTTPSPRPPASPAAWPTGSTCSWPTAPRHRPRPPRARLRAEHQALEPLLAGARARYVASGLSTRGRPRRRPGAAQRPPQGTGRRRPGFRHVCSLLLACAFRGRRTRPPGRRMIPPRAGRGQRRRPDRRTKSPGSCRQG